MTIKKLPLRKYVPAVALIGTTALMASGAHAAVDTSALTEATADIIALGTAAVAFALAAFGAFALFRRIPK